MSEVKSESNAKKKYPAAILWIPVTYIVFQLCFGVAGLYTHTFYGTRWQLVTTMKVTPFIPPIMMGLAWAKRRQIGEAVFYFFNLGFAVGWCSDLLGI